MGSLTTASNHLVNANQFVPYLRFPVISPITPEIRSERRPRNRPGIVLVLQKNRPFGFTELIKKSGDCGAVPWRCYCKGSSENDSLRALEEEILEFMNQSEKPHEFPTKKELVSAGRMDLVDAIVKRGGWFSMGWESDDEIEEDNKSDKDFDIRGFQKRVDKFLQSSYFVRAESGGSRDSSPSASPSGRSLEMGAEEDTGIEGILSRLQKDRNLSFGINLEKNGYGTNASSKDDYGRTHIGTSIDADRADVGENSRLTSFCPSKSILENSGGQLGHSGSASDHDDSIKSDKPETWMAWSLQRAGFSDTQFEAAEISPIERQKVGEEEDLTDQTLAITDRDTGPLDRHTEITPNSIKTRLQHLEFELGSALCSLRSKSEKLVSEDHETTSSDLQQLSDAWEFQENEIMHAKDRLRSIRAKLAVLEGKMALAIIDGQKILEEKQKSSESALRALQLLRTTCIVWHNPATEVLLVGSFDGWTTQRKMEKSRAGIFSVILKLYPGKYEIKFIVDGEWRVDPLRPTVNNNGHENNILIVT